MNISKKKAINAIILLESQVPVELNEFITEGLGSNS